MVSWQQHDACNHVCCSIITLVLIIALALAPAPTPTPVHPFPPPYYALQYECASACMHTDILVCVCTHTHLLIHPHPLHCCTIKCDPPCTLHSTSTCMQVHVHMYCTYIDSKSTCVCMLTCMCPSCYRNPLCGWEHWTGAALVIRRLVWARKHWVPFLFYAFRCCLLFFLASVPHCPRRSALSVLLFYCGTPCCCLMSSVPLDLWLFQYLLHFTAATYASYCGRYSPIGSLFLEPVLIPLWTQLQSSNHTIYTVPLPVSSL